MPEGPIETIKDQILVAASVIADISSGIYRSPANALKELISNSFDADAKNVTISTGHPEFEAMTCVDDGSGMTSEEFRKYMHAIGSSYKRVEKDYTPSGRPKIGKIGIGILAVGQICRKFSVISSTGNGKKFEAEINLAEFEAIEKEKKPLGQIGIGEYSGEIYREERKKKYTTLVLKEIRDDFRKRLLESQSPKAAIKDFRAKQAQPLNFRYFVEWLRGKKIQELSEYDQLIWGLSIAAPVEYLDDGPIRGFAGLRELKRGLKSYDFKVTVDGLEIRKPLLFPFGKNLKYLGRDYWVYDDIAYESESDGAKLKLTGYVYAQRKRISPPEYQGLLIRIRNVAIGGYDRSLLNYPKSEGPRPSLISGEIYVDVGLEAALNIDRNSFQETHAHFSTLQSYIFRRFGEENGIFSDLKKRSKLRMEKEREKETRRHYVSISKSIETVFHQRYTIQQSDKKSKDPIQIDERKRQILVNKSPLFSRKVSERRLMEKVLILFEVAYRLSRNKTAVYRNFYRLVAELE